MALRLRVLEELAAGARSWREADAPLASRGVSRSWLIDFVSRVQSELNGDVPPPRDFTDANAHDAEKPSTPYGLLNTHALVKHVIKPFTAELKAPLYAFVPEAHRGPPQTFTSHTWSSLLIGPQRQRIGTLDALRAKAGEQEEFVWVDFACYNQHLFESIAADMAHLVSEIGALSVVATPMPLFTRSWCLWELLAAYRAGAGVNVRVEGGWRNDKILSVNSLYRSFAGLAHARSTSQLDQTDIYNGFIATFGAEERANQSVRTLIEEKFANPIFELQDSKETLAFSAQPFAWGETHTAAGGTPFFLRGLLDCQIYGENRSIRDYLRALDVLPAHEAGDVVYDSRQPGAALTAEAEAANAELRARGESGRVEARAFDTQVVTPRGLSDRPTANETLVQMACPKCGTPIEVAPRPVYVHSDDPNSAWARFLRGEEANDCSCGFGFRGGPSFFRAPAWTAVTLEPPPGHALPGERYAVLIEELLRGRDAGYPLLVFDRNDEVRAALLRTKPDFATVPYLALMFGDYTAALTPLLLGALAVATSGRADVGYSMLRNACFVSKASFHFCRSQLVLMAQAWDDQKRESDMFDMPLLTDLGLLAGAILRETPPLDLGRMFYCSAAVAPKGERGETIAGARGSFTPDLRFDLARGGEDRCTVPPVVVAVPNPDALIRSKFDVILVSACEYLRRKKAKVDRDTELELKAASSRLNAALRSMPREGLDQLEAHYNTLGLSDLRRAVRQSWW